MTNILSVILTVTIITVAYLSYSLVVYAQDIPVPMITQGELVTLIDGCEG